MSTDLKTSSISVIIPTLNEASTLEELLDGLLAAPDTELLVVDGGSTDNTVDIAKSKGVQILKTAPGRAVQMNAGAEAASGDILLFLHSDTILTPGFEKQVGNVLQQPGVSAGAFSISINGNGIGLRVLEMLINFRSRIMQMPYGDQGIFMTSEIFFSVGPYPLQPIMEDFELVRKLRQKGKIKTLPLAAKTSARRWEKHGLLRTTIINQAIIFGYLLGMRPEKLADWYRRR